MKSPILQIGMLWFDNDEDKDPFDIFAEAAGRYFEKFGRAPELCHVPPDLFEDREEAIKAFIDGNVGLVFDSAIGKHHIWIGVAR